MADNQNSVTNLINGLEFSNPKLKTLLQTIADDLYGLNRQINPPTIQSIDLTPGGDVISVIAPIGFSATLFTNNIRLTWTAPGFDTFLYEIRLGPIYELATILLTTATLSADIDPVSRFIQTGVSYTFWVATVDNKGNHSIPSSVAIAIPTITAPFLTVNVIGNSVLLDWTIPESPFTISFYTVYRNGVFYGNVDGTFDVIFESVGGVYSYDVEAWDIVGNSGPLSSITGVIVQNPPDYQQFDSLQSTFTGTKINCVKEDIGLFAPIDTVKTWTTHFTSQGWTTIQDQINAGFPYYFEPNPLTASYEETFDFGALIVNGIIVGVSFGVSNITGTVAIQTEIKVSDDNITYTPYVVGESLFATQLRYVRVKLTFTPIDDTSGIIVSNLRVVLNVKMESEEGRVNALSTDATGTQITFNKTFKSIKALILVPESTTSCFAVYDSLTTTGAKIYVFDASGIRVSKTVSWLVRGVV